MSLLGFDGICELECWDKTDISPLALFQLCISDMLHIVSQNESGSPAHNKERHPWEKNKQTDFNIKKGLGCC